jgi:hypothetical protein
MARIIDEAYGILARIAANALQLILQRFAKSGEVIGETFGKAT